MREMKRRTEYLWTSFAGRLALLFLYLAVLSLYPGLNFPWKTVHSVALPIDAHIPLVPVFVIPYLFFFFPWAGALLLWSLKKKPAVFGRLIFALILGTAISYALYLLYQTAVFRPVPAGQDVFSTLVRWIYQSDARYNAFPSTHTVTTTILLLATWPLLRTRVHKSVAILVAVSILLSTLFIRQHNIADVVLGVLIAGLSFWVATRTTPSQPATQGS